ncbi:hypothetical protein [Ralstonia sp.]|uniref:hypothetical protein n=1 Tax=Ralstonia sp. TaxID=54061 RepID=UPI002BE057FB|nr:hypothetical protein [Ralstonia sp.]HWV06356.1 hypothetical protein [Ralstonia sp.]
MNIRSNVLVIRIVLLAVVSLIASLAATAALAAPPATVATCDGIKEAYQILGTQCANQYAKINHAPATAAERRETYAARIAVLEIFRKALLCNGMYNASKSAQQRFSSGEAGHLQALALLNVAMTGAGDPNVPALYTAADLNDVSINKQQCK